MLKSKETRLSEKKMIKINSALMNFLIQTNQPLSTASNFYFKHLLVVLQPAYEIPSNEIMKQDLIPEMVIFIESAGNRGGTRV